MVVFDLTTPDTKDIPEVNMDTNSGDVVSGGRKLAGEEK